MSHSGIYPFRDEDAPKEASLFRVDPHNPPTSCMPTRMGPDSPGFRRQRSIDEFWRDWFAGEEMSLEDLFPFRLRTAWRILRELARLRGVLTSARQTLADATNVHPTPWMTPFHFFSRMSDDPVINDVCQRFELPMLPPDIPALHVNGHVDESYDPSKDDQLAAFIKIAEHVASRSLFIPRTREGKLGLAGLFDPHLARIAWPSHQDIMRYESILVCRVFTMMLDIKAGDAGGEAEAAAMMRSELDLSEHEIEQVFAMARASAARATGLNDPESFFHMEVAHMQGLARKQTAREDYRGAAQTRRDVLRLVQGRETGEADEDYDRIVEAEMSKEKKRLRAPDDDDTLDTDPTTP